MQIKINKERQELRLNMFKIIIDKYDKKDLEKILLRYGIEEYKLNKKA